MRTMKLATLALATTAMTSTAPAFADGDHKISDAPMELTVHLHGKRYQSYDESWPVEVAACETTNVCLKNATVGSNSTNSAEAINLLLASGDLPDIVGTERFKDVVNEYGPQGAFLSLNELVDEHAPNIKAFFDKRPELKAAISASDGNYYYIPYFPDGKYGRAYFIRYDWLDALGLEMPQTVEEYEQVLIAFRDQDPNGNGLKDEIPFFARQWEELIRLVTLWDGRSSGSDTAHDFMVEGGHIKHPYAEEGYREGIKNLARWYAEGLVDPEIFTRGSSSREYLLSENLGGSSHDWFASTSGYNRLSAEIDGFAFKAFLPPASPSGRRIEEHRRIPVKPDGWAISYTNEHPVETIKYFDFWFSPEGRRLANFGVEGAHYDVVDGEPIYKEEILTNGRPVVSQMYEIGAQILARGYPQDYAYEIQWTNEFALEGIALYDQQSDLLIDQFLGVAFNEEEQRVYDKHWSQIRTYMLERQQAWILGSGNVEAEWDDYIAQVNGMGLSKVLEVMQAAYDRQYSDS